MFVYTQFVTLLICPKASYTMHFSREYNSIRASLHVFILIPMFILIFYMRVYWVGTKFRGGFEVKFEDECMYIDLFKYVFITTNFCANSIYYQIDLSEIIRKYQKY